MGQTARNFSEFITDKDGDYSKAQFLSLALKLLGEGRRPDRVFRAMLRAAYAASIQVSVSEHRNFVKYAAEDAADLLVMVEKQCDEALARMQNNP